MNERDASCEEVEESTNVSEGYDPKIACARSCIRGV